MPEKRTSLSDRYWKLPWLVRIGLIIGSFLVVASAIGAVNRATGGALLEASGPSSPAAAPSPSTPSAVDLPPGAITPGVYLVGTDVQPGTYRSQGAHPEEHTRGYCMWSRHDSAAGGSMDGIIASDGGGPGEQMIVTIAPDDVLFRTSGCEAFLPVR